MRLFAIFGGLILTMLIAVLVVPYFVNWSDYKGRFETAATQLTGLDVSVNGEADVRLLPFPSLSFTDVILGDGDDPIGVVERFSVDVELAPFLTGELHIFDMRLDGAQFVLDPAQQSAPDGDVGTSTDLASIIKDIKLEQATITNGSVLIRDDDGGDAWRITAVNGTLSADSSVGPFRYSGDGVVNGVPVEGQMSTGRLRADGFSLNTTTQWRNRGISVKTQGQVVFANPDAESAKPDQLHYDGALQVSPINDRANVLETPFLIEGVFVATEGALDIDQYRASFGAGEDPYTVEGGFSLIGGDAPTYALSARGTQLNWSGLADGDATDNFDVLLDQARGVFAQLPLPSVAGTVSIDLPAIIYGPTTLRDVRFNAVPAEQNDDGSALWRITRLEAKLPGRTQLEAKGSVNLPGQGSENSPLSFDGHVVLASRQPSGIAGWLGLQSGLAVSQLNRAGFEADVRLTRATQKLSNVMVVLNGDRLEGTIERTVLGDRPVLKMNLTGDALRDTTFNVFSDLLASAKAGEKLASDVDLAVNFTESVHRDIYVDRLKAALRIRPEQWAIDQLQIDGLFGASFAATAIARPQTDGYATDFDVSLVSADADDVVANTGALATYFGGETSLDFAAYVDAALERQPSAFRDASLTAKGVVSTASEALELTANLDGAVGGTAIGGTVRYTGSSGDPLAGVWGVDANVDNAAVRTLAAQLGFSLDSDQPGDMTVRLSGKPASGMEAVVNASFLESVLSFDGMAQTVASIEATEANAEGALVINGRDVDVLIRAFDLPIEPGFAAETPYEITSEIAVSTNDGVVLTSLDAEVAGQTATGRLSLKPEGEATAIDGKLAFSTLDATPLVRAFSGLPINATDDTAFGPNLLAAFSVDVDVEAQALTFAGFADDVENAKLSLSLSETSLNIGGFEAAAFDGIVTARIDLQSLDDVVLGDLQLLMRDVNITDLPLAQTGIEGQGTLSLAATGNGSSVLGVLRSLTGSGSVSTSPIIIEGINGAGLPAVIETADLIGFGITEAQIAQLVSANLTEGRTAFDPINAPLSVTNGSARLSSVALQSEDEAVSGLASVQLDLATGIVETAMDLRFEVDNALALGASPGLRITVDDTGGDTNFDGIQTYLVQRSIDREQKRIAALQARLSERQRLRRAVRQAAYQRDKRIEAQRLEAERLQAERLEAERLEAERLERARLEAEQAAVLERQRREEAEGQRRAAEKEAEEAQRQRAIEQRAQSANDPFRQEIERSVLPPARPAPDVQPGMFDNLELDFGN